MIAASRTGRVDRAPLSAGRILLCSAVVAGAVAAWSSNETRADPGGPSRGDLGTNSSLPASWHIVDVNNTWCGAKGLWLLTRGLGKERSFEDVRELCLQSGGSRDGIISLATLEGAARRLDLAARGVRCRLGWLKSSGVCALTLHRGQSGAVQIDDPGVTHHFLVLLPNSRGVLRIVDPFLPASVHEVSDEEFCETWTGDALLLARSDDELPSGPSALWAGLVALCALGAGVGSWVGKRRVLARRGAFPLRCLALVACSGACLPGCGAREPEAPLRFEQTLFRTVALAEGAGRGPNVVHSFRFVNVGSRAIRVRSGKPGCSCAVVRCPDAEVPPGGEGEVELNVDLTSRVGNFETYAPIFASSETDASDEGSAVILRVAAFVVAAAWARPASFEFGVVPAGTPASARVDVSVPLKPNEAFAGILIKHENEEVRYTTAEPVIEQLSSPASGKAARVSIDVEIAPRDAGRTVVDEFVVEVINRGRTLRILLRARVTHPDFTVEPPIVNFGPIGADAVERRVVVRLAKCQSFPGQVRFDTFGAAWLNVREEPNADALDEVALVLTAMRGAPDFAEGDVTIRLAADAPPYFLHYVGFRAH